MQTTTQNQKGCDDSCVGPECSNPLCHEGGHLETLIECLYCDQEFCVGHIYKIDEDQFSCGPCEVANTTKNPITMDHARNLLRRFGIDFTFTDSFTGRVKHISRDAGIISEGASL